MACKDEGNEMNYYQAMRILDRLKEGWDYPAYVIDQALRMTGDLG